MPVFTLRVRPEHPPFASEMNPGFPALVDFGAVQPVGIIKVVSAPLPEFVAANVKTKLFVLLGATLFGATETLNALASVKADCAVKVED